MTNKKILTLISFLLLFSFLLVGCKVVNQPPEITSTPVETATVGVDYTYNVVATDPNAGDVLTYSLTTEPEGMLINGTSGVITWKADDITAAGVGDYDVVVVVSDEGGLSDTQPFTITVSEFVKELIGIEVDPEEITVCIPLVRELDTDTFKVTANYNDDSTADVTPNCVYGTDDTSVATVEAGLITAKKVGTADISISYTEEGITKGTTLKVIVEGTIKIRWLEAAVRYNLDGSVDNWLNDLIPPSAPATLILTGGEYHFADANEFYNYDLNDFAGSVVIDGTGQLSSDATYTSPGSSLPIKDRIEGEVEIIIYGEEVPIFYGEDGDPLTPVDFDGTMVGTYTQWSYAYAKSDDETAMLALQTNYSGAVLAPEQGADWWFIGHTEYIPHGGDFLEL